jgi:hypothetical protein
MLRKKQNKSFIENESSVHQGDFIGIGVINPADLRLGANCIKVDCFKNQDNKGTLSLIIHKVLLYPFVKSCFQP